MSEVKEPKFCANCEHFWRWGSGLCMRLEEKSLVTGSLDRNYRSCEDERYSDEPDKCSKGARFFLEKRL